MYNCENCENLVEDKFHFCPYCGAPLTVGAKKLEDEKIVNGQLIALANLIRTIEDPKSLYQIDKLIRKLSKTK